LYDGGAGIVTRRKTLPLPSFTAKHLSAFAAALADDFEFYKKTADFTDNTD
jgi:hypothetical protein